MLRVLFFARIREALACAELEVEFSADVATLDQLQASLCEQRPENWQQVLSEPNMIRAVNQEVATGNPLLADGDEIAFFPPVTGG